MSNFDNPYSSSNSPGYSQPSYGGGPVTSNMALTSMILGIISLVMIIPSCCCAPFAGLTGVLGLVALVLGYMGLQEVNTQGKKGKEMAIAGMVCGGVGVALAVLSVILIFFQIFAGITAQQFQPNNF